MTVARVDRLRPGEHTVRFTLRGAALTGRTLVVDCLKLARHGVFEGEDSEGPRQDPGQAPPSGTAHRGPALERRHADSGSSLAGRRRTSHSNCRWRKPAGIVLVST